jgi:hypothetical protein
MSATEKVTYESDNHWVHYTSSCITLQAHNKHTILQITLWKYEPRRIIRDARGLNTQILCKWQLPSTYLVCSSRSKDAKYSSLQSPNPGMCLWARHSCCNTEDGKGSPLSTWPLIRSIVFWSYNLQSTSILFAAADTTSLQSAYKNTDISYIYQWE